MTEENKKYKETYSKLEEESDEFVLLLNKVNPLKNQILQSKANAVRNKINEFKKLYKQIYLEINITKMWKANSSGVKSINVIKINNETKRIKYIDIQGNIIYKFMSDSFKVCKTKGEAQSEALKLAKKKIGKCSRLKLGRKSK